MAKTPIQQRTRHGTARPPERPLPPPRPGLPMRVPITARMWAVSPWPCAHLLCERLILRGHHMACLLGGDFAHSGCAVSPWHHRRGDRRPPRHAVIPTQRTGREPGP